MPSYLNASPATDKPKFSTCLSESDSFRSWRLAESFICSENFEQKVVVAHLKSCDLRGKGLGAVANLIPEISKEVCEIGHSRMKTVVATLASIPYEIPYRHGKLRINSLYWNFGDDARCGACDEERKNREIDDHH